MITIFFVAPPPYDRAKSSSFHRQDTVEKSEVKEGAKGANNVTDAPSEVNESFHLL